MWARRSNALGLLFQTIALLLQSIKKVSNIVAIHKKTLNLITDYQLLTCCAGWDIKFFNKNMRKIIWIFKTYFISNF